MSLKDNIARYLDACFPILYLHSFEEEKMESLIKEVADRRTIATWSFASGYGEYSTGSDEWLIPPTREDAPGIETILTNKLFYETELNRSILVLKDAHLILENPRNVLLLKEIAKKISSGCDSCIFLLSPVIKIPVELEKYITILESDYQSYDEICEIINNFVAENELPELNPKLLEDLAISFKGLSEFEILNLLALAVVDDGELTHKNLSLIFEQKKQMILKSGILEMIPATEKIEEIGGMENLKAWLTRKSYIIRNLKKSENFGVDMPKGVLIAGMPGCGKSLCAKAAANLFEVPILRLDIGKLMGKYLGESEANLRKAIHLAEAISPCVLWIDELEKVFAGVDRETTHEVTTRLFASFLTWMQEKTSTTFVVATANDITKLPPELLRKERFDEIFFAGLPKAEERKKIFEIHIAKRRKQDLPGIDLDKLASKTAGYSGADIEGVVKEGIESAFIHDMEPLTTDHILTAISHTNSLSVIMKDSLDKMTQEYEKRKLKNASR